MSLKSVIGKAFNQVVNTKVPISTVIAPGASAFIPEKIKEKIPTVTPAGIAGEGNSLAKSIANGLATFASSTGDIIGRGATYGVGAVTRNKEIKQKAFTQKGGSFELPTAIGKWVGPIDTYTDRVITRKQEKGQGTTEALARTGGEALLDNPFGAEGKTLAIAGSMLMKNIGKESIESTLKAIAKSDSTPEIVKKLGSILDGTKDDILKMADRFTGMKSVDDIKKEIDVLTGKKEIDKIKLPENADPYDQRFVNTLNRLDAPTEAKDVIIKDFSNIRETVKDITGKPVSFDEVDALSKKIEGDLPKYYGRDETVQMFANQKKAMDELATKISETGRIDSETVKELFNYIESVKTMHGRGLNFIKQTGESLPEHMRTFQKVIDGLKKEGVGLEEILKKADNYDLTKLEDQQRLFNDLSASNWERWFDKLRYSSMLSSPTTHITNILSGLEGLTLRPIVKAVAGGIDATRSLITGSERTQFAGETVPYIKEILNRKNWGEALSLAGKTLKGEKSIKNIDIRQFPLANKDEKVKMAIEKAFDFPARLTGALDDLLSTIGVKAETSALNYRLSKGVQLSEDSVRRINGLVEQLANDEVDKLVFRDKMLQEGEGVVSNIIGSLGNVIKQLQYKPGKINTPVRLTAKVIFPFLNTMTSLSKASMSFTPVGLLDMVGAKNKTEVLAKSVIGMSITAAALKKAFDGEITGPYPKNASEKAIWEQTGKQPYSIKVGDKQVSFERWHPAIAVPLALAGSIAQKKIDAGEDDPSIPAMGTAAILATMKYVGNQGYARSVGDLFSAIGGDEEKMARLASSIPSQLVPFRSLLSSIDRMFTKNVPKLEGDPWDKATQQFINQLPLNFIEPVALKTDQEGEYLKNPNQIRKGNLTNSLITNLTGIKVSSMPDEFLKQYLDFKKAQSFKSEKAKTKGDYEKEIEILANEIRNTKDDDARTELMNEIIRTDEDIAAKVVENIEKKLKEPSYEIKLIKSMGVKDGTRDEYLKKRIEEFPTEEEQLQFIQDLLDAGIKL